MTNVLYLIGWNLIIAVSIGMAVWLICQTQPLRRRPALRHGLWLLVLLKLVAPPLVPIPVLPPVVAETHGIATGVPYSVEALDNTTDVVAPFVPTELVIESSDALAVNTDVASLRVGFSPEMGRFAWNEAFTALLIASLFVSLALWLFAWRHFRLVRRLLQGHVVQSGRAAALLEDVSRQFNLQSAPTLLMVDAVITPMLWAEPGNSAIVLPRQLADSLDDESLRNIIAHELGHFTRRDHWANLFAFFVTTLFWWNPIAWIARRGVTMAAEACCDALALERLSGSRTSYAKTLLEVVDFVATRKPLRPTVGTTFGESHALKRRFETLVDSNVTTHVSRAGWVLLTFGFAMLLLLPARAQKNSGRSVSLPVIATENATVLDRGTFSAPDNSEQGEPSENLTCYVTGVVFEEQTRKPIADAEVNLLIDSEQDPAKRALSGTTGGDGRYRIEVPLGACQIWFPRLKPGYWLNHAGNTAALATSAEERIVTHDIAVQTGSTWPVRVTVEGGLPDAAMLGITVTEVEDDKTRNSWLRGENVSFKNGPNMLMSRIDSNGTGTLTDCSATGKLVVSIAGDAAKGILTEFIIERGFDVARVKSIAPVAGTDKVLMTDEDGLEATIGSAEVTLQDGRPLLTFHLARKVPARVQKFSGRIVDAAGKPIAAVRVGSAIGSSDGSSGVTKSVATTDTDGQFVLNVPMPEASKESHLILIVTKDGYAGFDSPRIRLPKKVSRVIDVGKLTLQPGQSLPVRVVDENNRPLAGAVVEPQNDYAQRRQAIRTNSQGRGVLHDLPAGVVRVSVRFGALVHQSKVVVDNKPGEHEEITLKVREPFERRTRAKPFSAPPPVGAVAPRLSVVGWSDGHTHSLAEFRGKVVVLHFWGIWCSACLNNLPALKEVEARFADHAEVVFLGIHSAGTDMSQVKKLLRVKDWRLVTGLDKGTDIARGTVARAYGARGWPTTVIIDRQGKIAYNSNLEQWDDLTVFIEKARIAQALNLSTQDPEVSLENQVARSNAMSVFRLSELIDLALKPR